MKYMSTVLMRFVFLWLYCKNVVTLRDLFTHILQNYFTGTGAIFPLGQSCDCPSASEVILKDKDEIN